MALQSQAHQPQHIQLLCSTIRIPQLKVFYIPYSFNKEQTLINALYFIYIIFIIHKYFLSSFSNPCSFYNLKISLTGTILSRPNKFYCLKIYLLVSWIAFTLALRLWLAQITIDTAKQLIIECTMFSEFVCWSSWIVGGN